MLYTSTCISIILSSSIFLFFFFFSSRRRHTRLVSDWSSDVCSSDLLHRREHTRAPRRAPEGSLAARARRDLIPVEKALGLDHGEGRRAILVTSRSEERRVGKECRSRWSPYH